MIHRIDRHSADWLSRVRIARLFAAASHVVFCFAVCGLVVSINAHGAEADSDGDLRDIFTSVQNAIVRIRVTDAGHSGVGTIVTSEGHIVLRGAADLKGQALIVLLPDGRRANGVLLGWSMEWNVSLAKITDPGPWPFVKMASAPHNPSVNDPCFAVGYTHDEARWSTLPAQRIGRVSSSNCSRWFASSIRGNKAEEPFFAFGPVFSANGKLLGITASEPYGRDSIQLHTCQIQSLWQELLHGDVDKHRLFVVKPEMGEKRPYIVTDANQVLVGELSHAEQRAISCTVGIRKKTGERWSGVIISPSGWVATCGHGGQIPGDEVVVELADGRTAAARVTGANPITDISLVKIDGKETWPFAPLATTSDVESGTPCWFIGYPGDRQGRDPLVRKTKVVQPKGSDLHLLYTDGSYTQYGGDSGGGVFDLHGSLLAINEGKEPGAPGRHPRIETLRRQWKSLAKEELAK